MTMFLPLLSSAILATMLPVGTVSAEQQREQEAALAARREGRGPSLNEIQRRVSAGMPGAKYLGFDFDSSTAVYTLKFLRDGAMIWVLVDGRSGNVIGRSR